MGIFSSSPTRCPRRFAHAITSSQLTLLTGMNGQTSVAPMRGCAPLCLRISINSDAFLIRRYENVLARKLLEQGRWLAKVSRQNINRISGDPRRKINRVINSGVKTDQHPTRLAPDVFNRVPIALWNVPDIAGVQLLRSKSTMRAEHRHAEIAFDYILPFIGVRMPMKFAQRAWFEVENYASECCRNWKSRGIDTPFAAAFENRVRRTCEHS